MSEEKKIVGLLTEAVGLLKTIAGGNANVVDARFSDNGDGTISDKKIGLMWQKEGSEKELDFNNAEKYCKNSDLVGYSDWRLPTVDELNSLVDRTKYDPAISPVFKCKSSWYWTSTNHAGSAGNAWVVGFGGGDVYWNLRSSYSYVRPVRQY